MNDGKPQSEILDILLPTSERKYRIKLVSFNIQVSAANCFRHNEKQIEKVSSYRQQIIEVKTNYLFWIFTIIEIAN